jgi:glycosyltransferase involved in cell wall biosynthesis
VKRPPRIAIDVTPLLYTGGGIRRCTESLLTALGKRQTNFSLVPIGRRLLGKRMRFDGIDHPGVRLRLPRCAETLIRALGLIEVSCRADLYHATDFYMPLRSAHRGISTIHDVIFLRNPEPGVDHARIAKWIGDFAAKSQAIITCSQWTKNDLVATLGVDPQKIHVVYWGVDHDRFFPEPDRDAVCRRLSDSLKIERPYFLAVSCSMHRKNTPRLLRAYVELLKKGCENDLVVVWNPPAEIRELYQNEIADGRIRFTGRVDDVMLRDLYTGATATLYPSTDEGFGLPILESMSCGTPVITSNNSCLPEIGGDAAIYVDPLCDQSITDAMARFENRDIDINQLKALGLRRAGEFTWERCAEQTIDIYEQALANL